MTDKGPLAMDSSGDLGQLVASANGYSTVVRGGVILYPVMGTQLYFSRSPTGDGKPGNRATLVDFRQPDTV